MRSGNLRGAARALVLAGAVVSAGAVFLIGAVMIAGAIFVAGGQAAAQSGTGTAQPVAAAPEPPTLGPVTNLPVPRYVSLRSSRINVRRGPGLTYRKDWVFRRAGLPVRVVDEYGDWRRIVDKDAAGGWVYHAMITGRRTVLFTEDRVFLRETPSDTAEPTAMAERDAVARLRACAPDWCEVEAEGHRGWVRKSAIWGVEPGEVIGD